MKIPISGNKCGYNVLCKIEVNIQINSPQVDFKNFLGHNWVNKAESLMIIDYN